MKNWRTWAIATALVLGFAASEYLTWRSSERQAGEKLRVSVTPRFQKYDYAPLKIPVKAPRLPDKDLDRVREKYQRPDLVSDPGESRGEVIGPVILGEFRLGTPTDEAEILITREPDGKVGVDSIPVPRPFFEHDAEWEFGAGYSIEFPESFGPISGLEVWGRWSPARAGRWRPYVMGGIRPSGKHASAGILVRF